MAIHLRRSVINKYHGAMKVGENLSKTRLELQAIKDAS